MRNYKLGYDKERVILCGIERDMRIQFDALKSELLRNPNVLGVTAGSNPPTYGYLVFQQPVEMGRPESRTRKS